MSNEKEKLHIIKIYVNSNCLPHSCSSAGFMQGLSRHYVQRGRVLESQFSLYSAKTVCEVKRGTKVEY